MLEEILAHIKNWFIADWRFDHYVISGGKIHLPFVAAGQYFRVVGSVFNDGVYKYAASPFVSESFGGYSYTKANSATGKSGAASWTTQSFEEVLSGA